MYLKHLIKNNQIELYDRTSKLEKRMKWKTYLYLTAKCKVFNFGRTLVKRSIEMLIFKASDQP